MLARMRHPAFPEPIGVFRDIDLPTFDESVRKQNEDATTKRGKGDLQKLLSGGDTWKVGA